MKVDLTFGFQISNFKKGFYPREPRAENGLGAATMRVRACVWCEKASKGGAFQTKRARKN
jgi:hypothetical protein